MENSKKFVYFGILPGLFFQLVGAYFYFFAFVGSSLVSSIYTITKILIIFWPIVWIILGYRRFLMAEGVRSHWKSLIYGGLFGLVIFGATLGLFFLFEEFFSQFAGDIRLQTESLGILNFYIPFAVFISLIHSLIEEYYWRWFIFRGLMHRLSPLWAGIVGSVAFAGHHFVILSQFFNWWLTLIFGVLVGIGGGLWCLIYYRTRSIWGIWLSHFLVDAVLMVIGYMLIF